MIEVLPLLADKTESDVAKILRNSPYSTFYAFESHRGTVMVGMGIRDDLVAGPDEEKRITTHSLSGCTGVAIAAAFEDGRRYAYVQHYSPVQRDTSIRKIGLAARKANDLGVIEHSRAVIMTPTSDVTCVNTDAYERAEEMAAMAESGLGPDTRVTILPYCVAKRDYDRYGEGTLMIELTPRMPVRILADTLRVEPPAI